MSLLEKFRAPAKGIIHRWRPLMPHGPFRFGDMVVFTTIPADEGWMVIHSDPHTTWVYEFPNLVDRNGRSSGWNTDLLSLDERYPEANEKTA